MKNVNNILNNLWLENIKKHWIKWENYYFKNAKNIWINESEFDNLLISKEVFVSNEIIKNIIKINQELNIHWLELLIKEWFRSKQTYEIAYKLRVKKWWKENTNKLLNMKEMPHSTWKSIDCSLIDLTFWEEIKLHLKEDWVDWFHKNFYKDLFLNHQKNSTNQKLNNWLDELNKNNIDIKKIWEIIKYREILEKVMIKNWFKNKEHEYFHFDYMN